MDILFKRYATADIDDYIVYALNDTGNQYNDHLIAWRISTETWVDGDDTSIGDGTAGDQNLLLLILVGKFQLY